MSVTARGCCVAARSSPSPPRCHSRSASAPNTTIFSVASALLLRPLPGVAEPDRLVDIGRTQNGRDFDTSSYPNYRDIRARQTWLTDAYAIRLEPQPMGLGGEGGAERVHGTVVSGSRKDWKPTRIHSGSPVARRRPALDTASPTDSASITGTSSIIVGGRESKRRTPNSAAT
jgi:hypothetical protein